jgi:hypothetical protein
MTIPDEVSNWHRDVTMQPWLSHSRLTLLCAAEGLVGKFCGTCVLLGRADPSSCVVAGRLANLDHNLQVLLIEGGESNLNNPW